MQIHEIQKRQLITRRRKRMVEKAKVYNYPMPDRADLEAVFDESIKNGFKCVYCNSKLNIDNVEENRLATFDHIVPLCEGGSQSKDNLQIICVECNLLKGKYKCDTFKEFVRQTTKQLRSELYKQQDLSYRYLKQSNEILKRRLNKLHNPQGIINRLDSCLSKYNKYFERIDKLSKDLRLISDEKQVNSNSNIIK